jgi:hypothetical protein
VRAFMAEEDALRAMVAAECRETDMAPATEMPQ